MKRIFQWTLIMGLIYLLASPSMALGQFFFKGNPRINKPAPDFTLRLLESSQINLTEAREGQKAILFFWATWCPYCRTELKEFSADMTPFEAQDVKLLLINVGESKSVVQRYVERHQIDLDVLLDTEASVAEVYGVEGLPTYYFIREDGTVADMSNSLPEDFMSLFE